MEIEKIVAEYKEQGLSNDEIITELEKTFADLLEKAKEILGGEAPTEAEKEDAEKEQRKEKKNKSTFILFSSRLALSLQKYF